MFHNSRNFFTCNKKLSASDFFVSAGAVNFFRCQLLELKRSSLLLKKEHLQVLGRLFLRSFKVATQELFLQTSSHTNALIRFSLPDPALSTLEASLRKFLFIRFKKLHFKWERTCVSEKAKLRWIIC